MPSGVNRPFDRLSPCRGQVAYALLTRPPLAARILLPRAAARLACVRPAASVYPEPGSNSSLYEILYYSPSSPTGFNSRVVRPSAPSKGNLTSSMCGLPVYSPLNKTPCACCQSFSNILGGWIAPLSPVRESRSRKTLQSYSLFRHRSKFFKLTFR